MFYRISLDGAVFSLGAAVSSWTAAHTGGLETALPPAGSSSGVGKETGVLLAGGPEEQISAGVLLAEGPEGQKSPANYHAAADWLHTHIAADCAEEAGGLFESRGHLREDDLLVDVLEKGASSDRDQSNERSPPDSRSESKGSVCDYRDYVKEDKEPVGLGTPCSAVGTGNTPSRVPTMEGFCRLSA